ncbi:MAG: phosphatase [Alphaproteobacteria bacterium HGW-Alphaproteobacteria-16]|nr:MAG: phosphatase [Alphaproteobacteria bacterium HGW-Alphaproteobacteria-16]
MVAPDYDDGDVDTNNSGNPTLQRLIDRRYGRRDMLRSGAVAAMAAAFGGTLAPRTARAAAPIALGFQAVAKTRDDRVTVPPGYRVQVMTRTGDPLKSDVPDYRNDGTDTRFDLRVGDYGDALCWNGLSADGKRDEGSSTRGLIVQNHEAILPQYLHPAGPTMTLPRPQAEVEKEIAAHGVSVTEHVADGARGWNWRRDSAFNRRITPNTPVTIHGPARGAAMMRTAYSPDGTAGRGTIANCANGRYPWGTMTTCEENWAGFFTRPKSDDAARSARELVALRRYGVTRSMGNFGWSSVVADEAANTLFRRWDARTRATPESDFRNEPNQFGWCVEMDPYDPSSTPRKRTALGRMGHEGAWPGRVTPGKPVAVYMGDDARGEYIYKFVSDARWDAADANAADRLAVGDKYLDSGTLYVARFDSDGTGAWLPLRMGDVPNRPAKGDDAEYVFADQADILIHARLAADAVGATPMDRPEWTATNPATGEIYITLTNNSAKLRPLDGTDAANPRHYDDPQDGKAQRGNPNGHILRLREAKDDPGATRFHWDIYLFGADSAEAGADINVSALGADNDFSSPDGLFFSHPTNAAGGKTPLLWIQTDDGALEDRTNNQMLAAIPGTLGDGAFVELTNTGADGATARQRTRRGAVATTATLRRFLVGPVGCEVTGVDTTPDGRTLFVGIQHPGEDGTASAPGSAWPASQATGKAAPGTRPRSAVVAITREDGGIIGL